jgi:hypothetical protein
VVRRRYSEGACAEGWHDPERQIIFLAPGMMPAGQRETLLHEIIHALNKLLQLTEKPTDEEICMRLAPGLLTVFVDNPKFAKWLISSK